MPQMDRASHSLFDYFLCRVTDHSILPYHYIVEFKPNTASGTGLLSYVGGLYHLWPVRLL